MTRPRILIVDDDAAVLKALRRALLRDRDRWDCVFGDGGKAAIAELDASPFDVVITDMYMPGLDGAALLVQVKDRTPATVRIMLSGSAEHDLAERVNGLVDQLLAKPCDTATLRGVIERWLVRDRRDREAET